MAHILLLEDTKDMRTAIRDSLEMSGHDVITGKDGRDGFAYLESEDPLPDLIITDLKMPEIGGLAFMQQMRQHAEWTKIPIIATSGVPGDETAALSAGADVFIVKPFKHSELETLIQLLLQ